MTLVVAFACAIFAGCGGGTTASTATPAPSTGASAAAGSDVVPQLQAKLDALRGIPEFDTAAFKGEAFDAKTAMAGQNG